MMQKKKKPEVLALIGARSGSKSIPHKNIKSLGGRPLLGWIINAAKGAKHVTRVMVSTDSEEYARVARMFGAQTPFIRPAGISGDTAQDLDYITHALEWLDFNEGYKPDAVVRLIPTVPLQRPEDIDMCLKKLFSDSLLDSVVGIAEARQHPGKALKITDKEHLTPYVEQYTLNSYPNARQVHVKAYFRGNIIATRADVLRKGSLYGERSGHHVIPQPYAWDIDTEWDFLFLETLLEKMPALHTNIAGGKQSEGRSNRKKK